MSSILAVSPIDGRYHTKTKALENYFSEYALIKYRVKIEVEYFIALCELGIPQLKSFNKKKYRTLRNLYLNFSVDDALNIKEIEKTTNHDVKAVEYFLKNKFDNEGLTNFKEFIHFGLTSQDINNTAVPLSLRDAVADIFLPELENVLTLLYELAGEYNDISMLARTHGQPASPTRLGKEFFVFIERIEKQKGMLKLLPFPAKFGGATGNFNAHKVAFPNINWKEFANTFVNHVLELERSQTTTQIEHYDNLAALFDNFRRINIILLDFARDMWTYISMDYFKQKIKAGEVGSSAMPHKVNPIDFENAEGNLGIANALFDHLSNKLPVSRLQRDLTDSTVLRNIGVPIAHTLIAFKSVSNGLSKLLINKEKIAQDLQNNWLVVAEGIQNILRRESYPNPYEALKDLTRTNEKIGRHEIHQFIDNLNISEILKTELRQITPENYTGF